jgi:hypothetical protein
MPTFYEQLNLQSSVTPTEIEVAIEEQYNQWRRLITHHDPNIVNQANQSLQTLESIRTILLDPDKRMAYDAGIGVSGPIGGLADPAALLRTSMPFTPPTTATSQPRVTVPNSGTLAAEAWVCPKCQTINPLKTKFCAQCGQQLGRDCPSCGKLTKASAPFCSECGVNFEAFFQQKKVEDDAKQRVVEMRPVEMELARKWLAETESTKNNYRYGPVCEAVIAEGSFNDVFEYCRLAVEKFRFSITMVEYTTTIKEFDLSTGKIMGILAPKGLGKLFTAGIIHINIHILIQKNLLQCRGVMIICCASIPGGKPIPAFAKSIARALSGIQAK